MGFGGAEAVLSDVNSIASNKRTAFQARLKNFQRLGLLRGVQEGRGRAARYQAHHLLWFAIAVEFGQLGLQPEAAVAILRRSERKIAEAIKDAPASEAEAEGWSPQILYFDPVGLAPLMEPMDEADRHSFTFATPEEFTDDIYAWFAARRTRLAVVDIMGLVAKIAEALDRVPELQAMRPSYFFGQALWEWAKAECV